MYCRPLSVTCTPTSPTTVLGGAMQCSVLLAPTTTLALVSTPPKRQRRSVPASSPEPKMLTLVELPTPISGLRLLSVGVAYLWKVPPGPWAPISPSTM